MDGVYKTPQAQSYHDAIAINDGGRVSAAAVIFLMSSIASIASKEAVRGVALTADLIHFVDEKPSRMVPESDAAALFRATTLHFNTLYCDQIFERAGQKLARYMLRHRMRHIFTDFTALMPRALRASMLASAINRQAFIFIPSHRFSFRLTPHPQFRLTNNPLQSPGGVWHLALFKTLYRAAARSDYSWTCRRESYATKTIDIFSARQPR